MYFFMNSPIISIVVPCYNQSQYLRETLDSLLIQSISNWECIIVNDGSTDNSLAVANRYVEKDNRFIVVDKPNGGLADARNVGIRSSHGKYVLPLDSDDLIAPTYAEKAVSYLENHPEVILVYCKAKYFGDRNDEWSLPDYDYYKLIFGNHIFCSCVFRRCDYDRTGGYNTNMIYGWEDWDFLLSLLNKDSIVYRIPEVLFFYRKHGTSMIDDIINKHYKEMGNRIVANHIDIYYPYLNEILYIKRKDEEIDLLRKELENIKQSRTFRFTLFFMKALRPILLIISEITSGLRKKRL